MTSLIVALLCFACGFGLAWWILLPRQQTLERIRHRSRVLYELAEGDFDNVAHELEQIAESEPRDSTVFLALAAIDRRRGRIERAKVLHRTVLASAELSPDMRVAAFVGLGRDLLAEGNEQAAVGALSRAISLAPRSAATLESLAKALEQAKVWERAAAAWERHEKLVDGQRRQQSRIGRGHALACQAAVALQDGEQQKAQKLIARALELAPASGHLWFVMAQVSAALDQREEALDAWQAAWELAPCGAQEIVHEAWTWAERKAWSEALLERMMTTLLSTQQANLIVVLAKYLAAKTPEQVKTALERIQPPSAEVLLALLTLSKTQRFTLPQQPTITPICRLCAQSMESFSFHCPKCGAWDSAIRIQPTPVQTKN